MTSEYPGVGSRFPACSSFKEEGRYKIAKTQVYQKKILRRGGCKRWRGYVLNTRRKAFWKRR